MDAEMSVLGFLTRLRIPTPLAFMTAVELADLRAVPVEPATVIVVVPLLKMRTSILSPAFGMSEVTVDDAGRV